MSGVAPVRTTTFDDHRLPLDCTVQACHSVVGARAGHSKTPKPRDLNLLEQIPNPRTSTFEENTVCHNGAVESTAMTGVGGLSCPSPNNARRDAKICASPTHLLFGKRTYGVPPLHTPKWRKGIDTLMGGNERRNVPPKLVRPRRTPSSRNTRRERQV